LIAGLSQVSAAMLGTTQFVNALVQQRDLAKVLVVRLCGPATIAMPPFIDFPHPLIKTISAGYILANGKQRMEQDCKTPAN
jgi:N-methylhydantoinase A/oxoprolinase/acetone carboxylase beta subunit